MSKIMRYVRLIVPAVVAIFFAPAALALVCTSAATGNWSAAATWAAPCNIAGGPVAADTVTIAAAHTVTVNANSAATSITIAAPSVAAHGININPGIALTVSGAITMTAPAANNQTSTLAVGSGMLNAGSIAINGGTPATRISQVTVSTGTITVTGAITSGGTTAQARLISAGASMINVGGNFTPGAFTSTGSTLNINGAAAQTVGGAFTYNNLTVNKTAGTATLGGATTIGGTLDVTSGTLTAGAFALTVTGATTVDGTLSITSATGAKTFVGAVTINAGGIWTNTTAPVIFRGGLTHNGATFTAGTGVYTFNTTAAQALNCAAALAIPSITVTAPTVLTNNCPDLTVATALAGNGNLTNIATTTLNIGGTSAITTLTATAVGNVVNYTGAAAQTIKATTYDTLNFSGAGVKTNSGIVTVNTALTGTAMTNAATGTLNISGTSTLTTLTATAVGNVVNYTGAGQTIKAASYSNLNVTGTATNSGTVTVAAALGGAGTLTNAATGILNIGGTSTITTLDAATAGNAVNYTGAAAQTIKATTYDTLNTSGAGVRSIAAAAAVVVNNTLTVNAVAGGVLTNNGTLTVTTALSGLGGLTNAATGILNIGGTSTITTLTATAVGNTVNYTGSGQTIKATSYSNLNVTDTATNSGTVTVATVLGGTGTLTNAATGILNIGGTSTITTLDVATAGNVVNYTGAAAQTIIPTTYDTLNFSGAGVKTNSGIVTVNTALTGTAMTNAATGTLNIGGTSTITTLTATAAGNLVNYNGVAAQTIKATTYSNVTINKPAGVTASLAGTTTIGGTLDVTSGTLTAGAFALTVTGATTVDGTLSITSATGAKTFVGAVTINAGGVWSNTGNAPVIFRGGLTHNGATFTGGTGTQTFNTNSQAISGTSPINFGGIVAVTGAITITNNNTNVVTITGNLTGSAAGSTWVNAANSTLNYGGAAVPMGARVFTATAVGNTVNYTGAAQTVRPVAYSNLGLAGSGAKTLTGVNTVGGNLTMSDTATATAATALTVGGSFTIGATNTFANVANALNVAGNFAQDGTFTAGAGVVTLNGGAAVQIISGAGTLGFANLTVSNAGITLARNVTVTSAIIGAVTLTSTCPTDYTLTSNGGVTVAHSCLPATVVSINCTVALCPATSAATVSWTVIFNQSVTGVDATAFTLAASGVSGAYITTVTGSGTTWTVTANTGIGSGTLGLNQTGPGAVVPTLSGTFTGQVYTITSTPALAEYRMDEARWNGTTDEVVDSSGSYPGTAGYTASPPSTSTATTAFASDPAHTSGVQSTCRYGLFDTATAPVKTGTYVQLKSTFPPLSSSYSVTAWIRSNDITRAGQRIFVNDDSNQGWAISLGDGGAGRLRVFNRTAANSGTPTAGGYNPGCGVFCLGTNPGVITNGAWYFVAVTVDAVNSQVTLYAYDSALSPLVATSTAYTGTWGTDPGATAIGGETSVSGEYGGTFAFVGNIDEVRVYQKVLSQAALTSIAAQTHVCPINIPDHLEIHSSGTGVTCTPSTLTVVACADAACTPYTLGVTGTLSASGPPPTVNWDGTTGGLPGAWFDIPVGGSSVTKNVQVTTPGSVVFGISFATPAPVNPTICNFGSPSCTFTAADTGFLVSAPDHVAETASTLTVQAVKKADNSLACVPAFQSVSKTVNLKCAYVNPATGTLSARVGGSALNATNNAAAACDGSGGNISLSFNASGIATPSLQYADVGSMQINASYAGAGLDAGLSMTGSGAFIAAPASFAFSSITPGPIKAGNDFSATVTALNSASNAAPNFGHESAAEGVTLTSALVSPLGGANTALANGSIAGGTFSNGAAAVANLSWGEVGNITLNAALTSASYLGSGLTATGTSATVGVFIPDHFDTSVVPTATLPMPCPTGLTCPVLYSGFVYSGQPFSVQVIARNLAGSTTANYDGALGFSKTVTLTAWDALGSSVTQNPGGGVLGGNSVLPTAFVSGEVTLTDTPAYTFTTALTAPTDIYVRATDADASSRRTVPATSVEGGVKVVSGRVKIGNAHGSELLPLPMTATVQYYNGTNWLTSLTDSVTSLTLALSSYQCKSGCAWTTTPTPAGGQVIAGVLPFKLSKPSSGGTGSVDVSISTPNYLLTGSNGAAVNPTNTARATFGVYKGNNDFIYLRENY